jgi:hypothetical protein
VSELAAFVGWLRQFRGEESPRGDLQEDIARDIRFRKRRGGMYRSLKSLATHIELHGCYETNREMVLAMRDFKRYRRASRNHPPSRPS